MGCFRLPFTPLHSRTVICFPYRAKKASVFFLSLPTPSSIPNLHKASKNCSMLGFSIVWNLKRLDTSSHCLRGTTEGIIIKRSSAVIGAFDLTDKASRKAPVNTPWVWERLLLVILLKPSSEQGFFKLKVLCSMMTWLFILIISVCPTGVEITTLPPWTESRHYWVLLWTVDVWKSITQGNVAFPLSLLYIKKHNLKFK